LYLRVSATTTFYTLEPNHQLKSKHISELKRPEPEWVAEYERSQRNKGGAGGSGGDSRAQKLKVKKERAAAASAAAAATDDDDQAPPTLSRCGHHNRGRQKFNGQHIEKCTHCGSHKPLQKLTNKLYESKYRPACESMVWHR
jgi:hypothetical protein